MPSRQIGHRFFLFSVFTGLMIMGIFTSCTEKISGKFNGRWETERFELAGIAQEICISHITLEETSAEVYSVNGNAGINSFFGTVSVKNGRLRFSENFGITEMAGDPRAMEFEDNFINVLMHSDSVELVQDPDQTMIPVQMLEISSSQSQGKIILRKKD